MSETQDYLIDKKVAVVSDDKEQLEYLEKSFLCAGAQVYTDSLDKKTFSFIKNQKPDLVIFESKTSSLLIGEIIKSLRNESGLNDVPVLTISQADNDEQLVFDNTKFISNKSLKESDVFTIVKELMVKDTSPKPEILDLTDPVELPETESVGKGIRVMILEDDPLWDLLSTKLTKSNIEYKVWHNGIDAISYIKLYNPTVMIFDISLPGKSGLEVLAEIRDLEMFKDTPVIIFSNNDNPEAREKAEELGVSKFFIKAMTDLNDLINFIQKVG